MDWENLQFSLLLILLIGVSVGSIFGPGGSAATPDPQANIYSCVDSLEPFENRVSTSKTTNITIHRTGDNGTVRLRLANPPKGLELSYSDSIRFTDSKGFDVRNGRQSAVVTAEQNETWVNVTSARWEEKATPGTAEGNVLVFLPESNRDVYYSTNSSGYVGSHFALIGPHERTSVTVGCQKLQVVVPESAESKLRYSSGEILEHLKYASREIAIGHRYSIVTAFVAPGDFGPRTGYVVSRRGTRDRGSSEMVLSPNISKTTPDNAIAHEYVHTRQRNVAPRWVAEGQASFLATELSIQAEWSTARAADSYWYGGVNSSTGRVDPNRKNHEYARGYYFFHLLDQDLAKQGVGLESVIANTNSHDYQSGRGGSMRTWNEAVRQETEANISLIHPYQTLPTASYWLGPEWIPPEGRAMLSELEELNSLTLILTVLLLGAELWNRGQGVE